MTDYIIDPKLERVLNKLFKKNRVIYLNVMNKIENIASFENINHFKNLHAPMSKFKRVHINKSLVLLFYQENDTIVFFDLDHHDNIYKKQ